MINIVAYEPQHAAGVVNVILPIQQTEFEIPISLEMQPDLQDIPRFYQHGVGNFWVALANGEVVGTVALLDMRSDIGSDISNRQVALRKMFVKASHRGSEYGVAKRLLDTVLQWCRSQSVREIYLGTTEKFLAAHRFYEKNGFAEIAKDMLPASFPIMSVDTKFYAMLMRTPID